MAITVPRAAARPLDDDKLEKLALVLVAGLDDDPEPESEVLVIGILPSTPGELAVAVKPLEGGDPIATVVGFDAPDDWHAVGIVATGRWFAMSEQEFSTGTVVRQPRGVPGGRVRMAHFVTRDGAVLLVMSKDGDEPIASWPTPTRHYGRADDVCRRALGLATAPPAHDVRELWALVWCDVIAERVLTGSTPSWTAIASAHPAIGQLGAIDAEASAWAVDNLVRLGNEYGRLHSWDDLRQACARNEWPIAGIEPDDAAWMDTGMFSRWACAPYPELVDLLEDLAVLLPPESAYRVWRTADAWGLP